MNEHKVVNFTSQSEWLCSCGYMGYDGEKGWKKHLKEVQEQKAFADRLAKDE